VKAAWIGEPAPSELHVTARGKLPFPLDRERGPRLNGGKSMVALKTKVGSIRWPILAAGVLALTAAAWPASLTPCQEAVQWVTARKTELPQTLTGLRRLPFAYRRYAYSQLAPSVRQAMWKEHISAFLDPSFSLTETQRAVTARFIARVDAYVSDDPTGRKGRDALRADRVDSTLKATFDPKVAHVIFAGNGFFSDDGRGFIAGSVQQHVDTTGGPSATGKNMWVCTCLLAINGDGNCPNFCTGNQCEYSQFGCGWTGVYPCDGVCSDGR
jgi:hypothetical protein